MRFTTRKVRIYSAFCLECGRRIEFPEGKSSGALRPHPMYRGQYHKVDNPHCPNPGPQPDTLESTMQEFGSLSL